MSNTSARDEASSYIERCTVCGHTGALHRQGRSIRETYRCGNCDASLRYREQARLILEHFSRENSRCLAELANEAKFQKLRIYEPGLIGPFRKIFSKLPGYRNSFFRDDVEPGEFQDSIQCQDLTRLTYKDNTFDLVLSSDIFEHVKKPFAGFKEIDRVLKPGGFHIFSIPPVTPHARQNRVPGRYERTGGRAPIARALPQRADGRKVAGVYGFRRGHGRDPGPGRNTVADRAPALHGSPSPGDQ